jgi:hypothetical protein
MIGWLMNLDLLVGWELSGETEVIGENLPQCQFVHQIPYDLTWDRNLAVTMRIPHATARTMACPLYRCYVDICYMRRFWNWFYNVFSWLVVIISICIYIKMFCKPHISHCLYTHLSYHSENCWNLARSMNISYTRPLTHLLTRCSATTYLAQGHESYTPGVHGCWLALKILGCGWGG